MLSQIDARRDWFQINKHANTFFRKREVTSLPFELNGEDLGMFLVAIAPFGGCLATVHHPRKLVQAGYMMQSHINIYTQTGEHLGVVTYHKHTPVDMSWTIDENLVVVFDDGKIMVFDLFGEMLSSLSLLIGDARVMSAAFYSAGCVVATDDCQLFLISDYFEHEITQFSDIGLRARPCAMAVIDPQFTLSGLPEVYIATRPLGGFGDALIEDGGDLEKLLGKTSLEDSEAGSSPKLSPSSLYVLDTVFQKAENVSMPHGPFDVISISGSGSYIALFNRHGDVLITNSDLQQIILQFSTESDIPPSQMCWCGDDAVVMNWDMDATDADESLLIVVGLDGSFERMIYQCNVSMVTEIDGIRIISNNMSELLEKVPTVTSETFGLSSITPAALLYDAFVEYRSSSPDCIKNIQAVRDNMKEAIDSLLESALHEILPEYQVPLLNAASFGKSFDEYYQHDKFVDVCKLIRVLNSVRTREAGLPITFRQFDVLGVDRFIDRLLNRHQHLLSVRISEYLGISPDRSLVHWACCKVRSCRVGDEEKICSLIHKKLSKFDTVSYAQISNVAFQSNNVKLATLLLNYEPRAHKQVPLLLQMQEDEIALQKALESRDADLVYYVILFLRERSQYVHGHDADGDRELYQRLYPYPQAKNLLVKYYSARCPESLHAFYSAERRYMESASLFVREHFDGLEPAEKLSSLESARMEFSSAGKTFEGEIKLTEEQEKLTRIQSELYSRTGDPRYVGASLIETMHLAIVFGFGNEAQNMAKEFKISDKQWCIVRLNALAEIDNFEGIEKLSQEKRNPPIGWKPFVEISISYNRFAEAAKYIPRLSEPEDRVRCWMQIGLHKEAADTAFQARSYDLLESIRPSCSRAVQEIIDRMLTSLSQGGGPSNSTSTGSKGGGIGALFSSLFGGSKQ